MAAETGHISDNKPNKRWSQNVATNDNSVCVLLQYRRKRLSQELPQLNGDLPEMKTILRGHNHRSNMRPVSAYELSSSVRNCQFALCIMLLIS